MNSRDAILHRIRTRLSSGPTVAQPPVPEVWPRENPDRQTMAARFAEELTAIFGEVIRCDFSHLPNVTRWLNNMKKLPSWAAINEPLSGFAGMVKDQPFKAITP